MIVLFFLFVPLMLLFACFLGRGAIGPALGLLLGVPTFGLVMLASGADNHDFAVGIIFAIVCWFVWVFRKQLRS
jgi:hypothetical protein